MRKRIKKNNLLKKIYDRGVRVKRTETMIMKGQLYQEKGDCEINA
jgi:hypothetical protein